MKVSIKTTSGETYEITIPDNSAIKDLKATAVVASKSLSSSDLSVYSLYFQGVKLDLLKTVSEYEIKDHSTIIIGSKNPEDNVLIAEFVSEEKAVAKPQLELKTSVTNEEKSKAKSSPVRSPTRNANQVSKKKKNGKNSKKCYFTNCNNASLRMIGHCTDCNGNFCSKHRLMENHLCSGLSNCKKAAFTRNANKLHQEQTISQKV